MRDGAFKVGLIAVVSLALIGAAAILENSYFTARELKGANVRARFSEGSTLKEVAGFYGKSNEFSRIVVRTSFLPGGIEPMPILSVNQAYARNDAQFDHYSQILTNGRGMLW